MKLFFTHGLSRTPRGVVRKKEKKKRLVRLTFNKKFGSFPLSERSERGVESDDPFVWLAFFFFKYENASVSLLECGLKFPCLCQGFLRAFAYL